VAFELGPAGGSWNFSTIYLNGLEKRMGFEVYTFCTLSGCADGEQPYTGSLIFDSAGNLYGTTSRRLSR
jgi:hypothetical protein